MRKIVFLIVVVSLVLFSCKSNYTRIGDKNANYIPYYLKVYEADSLFIVGDYKRSYKILDSLFKKFEPVNMTGFYEYDIYISSCIMSENTKGIKKKLKTAYTKYGSSGIVNSNKLEEVAKKMYDKNILNKDKKVVFIAKYKKNLNLLLRSRIEEMIDEDQRVRLNNMGNDSLDFFTNKHKLKLIEIFNKYGYPNQSLIGNDNRFKKSADIGILITHQNIEFKEQYLSFFLDELKKGKISPYEYASIYDKYFWDLNFQNSNRKLQYFGTIYKDFESGDLGMPLSNPTKIDSIRKSIGMGKSYRYEIWKHNQIF